MNLRTQLCKACTSSIFYVIVSQLEVERSLTCTKLVRVNNGASIAIQEVPKYKNFTAKMSNVASFLSFTRHLRNFSSYYYRPTHVKLCSLSFLKRESK